MKISDPVSCSPSITHFYLLFYLMTLPSRSAWIVLAGGIVGLAYKLFMQRRAESLELCPPGSI
jgi:hypothetical protein